MKQSLCRHIISVRPAQRVASAKLVCMILASTSIFKLLSAAAAVLAYGVLALRARRQVAQNSNHIPVTAPPPLHILRSSVFVACAAHALSLVAILSDRPLHFGFATALSLTAWVVLLIYAVETRLYPQLQARWAMAALGAGTVVLALLFPGVALHASTSAWMPLHWAFGLAAYGLFAAAVTHAVFWTRAERQLRQGASQQSGLPLLTLERLTFHFASAGFLLLTATLSVGLLLSTSGQAFWHWDHKTVFSVLAWLVFLILLLGRWQMGWRGRNAIRWLYAGVALLLLAYVGSRFVLEVILGRIA